MGGKRIEEYYKKEIKTLIFRRNEEKESKDFGVEGMKTTSQ